MKALVVLALIAMLVFGLHAFQVHENAKAQRIVAGIE
jgi:hypothetical protein